MHIGLVLPVQDLIRGTEEAVPLLLEPGGELIHLATVVPQTWRDESSRKKPHDRFLEERAGIVVYCE
jgi:hypothetical protein